MFHQLKFKIINKYQNSLFYKYIGSAVAHPKNFIFCLKYPFWKSRNVWSGKFMGYAFTWYDSIPQGWKIAFGKQLTEDIVKALKADNILKRNWCKNLYFEQIKEKWGTLRIYASTTEKIQNIFDKYEQLSMCYCIYCGKPARYCTKGYVSYVCKDCWEINYRHYHGNKKMMKQVADEERLTEADIPHFIRYIDAEHEEEINFGINFKKMWGLN